MAYIGLERRKPPFVAGEGVLAVLALKSRVRAKELDI